MLQFFRQNKKKAKTAIYNQSKSFENYSEKIISNRESSNRIKKEMKKKTIKTYKNGLNETT